MIIAQSLKRAVTWMIHYYFGSGKGKTSAAVGALIRAAGSGMRCAMVQFLKNGTSSEISVLKNCGIDVFACRFEGVRFFGQMNRTEQEAVIQTHNDNLRRILSDDYRMIVLDELSDAVIKHAAEPELVAAVLALPDTELIITGHKRAEMFIQCADYITEFQCIAHPFRNGVPARKGIEF